MTKRDITTKQHLLSILYAVIYGGLFYIMMRIMNQHLSVRIPEREMESIAIINAYWFTFNSLGIDEIRNLRKKLENKE